MKITEHTFRIGNYVKLYRRPIDKDMSTYAIKSIYFDDVDEIYYLELSDGFKVNLENGVRPIDLTIEWVNSLFEDQHGPLIWFNDKFCYVSSKELHHPLTYVHELQNLHFDFTGIILK